MSSAAASQPESRHRGQRQRLRPDRQLVRRVLESGGEDLRKCMQCATCSSVCEVLVGRAPGPRKEMLWAQWGLTSRLMSDPNLWLCHQCGDCTRRCPRGARPADVLAALRRECIVHYSWPCGFGRIANRPASWLWVLLGAVGVLLGAAAVWQWSGAVSAELALVGKRAVFPFWTRLPHGLLGSVFGALAAFDVLVLVRGARRFWRDLVAAEGGRDNRPAGPGLRVALSRILFHEDFAACTANRARRTHHLLVVFGMLALWLTSVWAVAARWNPLLHGLVYPFAFWDPWKLMANAGGLSVLLGSSLMLWERWRRPQSAGTTTPPDAFLPGLLLLIALTGFAAEALHWLRVEPLRFAAYSIHLAFVFVLMLLLPYSKLAHAVYRTVAMCYAEYTGRRDLAPIPSEGEAKP